MGESVPGSPQKDDGGRSRFRRTARDLTNEEMNDHYILNQRILYLESKCDKLDEANRFLRKELGKAKEEQKDVTEHLKENLKNNVQAFQTLERENDDLKAKIEQLQREMQEKLAAERERSNKEQEKLEEELEKARRELHELHTFKLVKQQMEQDMEDLRQTLEMKDEQMKQAKREMERNLELERARLAKELADKIQEVKEMLERDTDDKLDLITKKTALANEQMSWELSYQSKETKKIVAENDELRTNVKTLQQELNLSKEREAQLAKKSHSHQKTVDKLIEAVKSLEVQLEETQTNYRRTKAALAVANREIDDLASQKTVAERNLEGLRQDHEELRMYATSVAEKAESAEKNAEERSRFFLQEIIQAEYEQERNSGTAGSKMANNSRTPAYNGNKAIVSSSFLKSAGQGDLKTERNADPTSRRSPPRSREGVKSKEVDESTEKSPGMLISGRRPPTSSGSDGSGSGKAKSHLRNAQENEGDTLSSLQQGTTSASGATGVADTTAVVAFPRRRDVVRGRTVGKVKGKPAGRTVGTEGGAPITRSSYSVHNTGNRPRLRELSSSAVIPPDRPAASDVVALSLDDGAIQRLKTRKLEASGGGKTERLQEMQKKEREEEKGRIGRMLPPHEDSFAFGTLSRGSGDISNGVVANSSSSRTLPSPNNRLVAA